MGAQGFPFAGAGGSPGDGQGQPSPGVSPGNQQVQPLQQALGEMMRILKQMSSLNPVVQPELEQATQALAQAMQKTMMSARPEQPSPAGGGAGGGPQGQGGPQAQGG